MSSQTFVEYVNYKPNERGRERVGPERTRRGRMCLSSRTLLKCVVPYMVPYYYKSNTRVVGRERDRDRERERESDMD